MSVWIGGDRAKIHLLPETYRGQVWRVSACGLWRHHGRHPDNLQRGTTDDVTCGRCRRTALFNVAKREENN